MHPYFVIGFAVIASFVIIGMATLPFYYEKGTKI
jgi:hypothetical protein